MSDDERREAAVARALSAGERSALDRVIGPDARGAYRKAEDVWVAACEFATAQENTERAEGEADRLRAALQKIIDAHDEEAGFCVRRRPRGVCSGDRPQGAARLSQSSLRGTSPIACYGLMRLLWIRLTYRCEICFTCGRRVKRATDSWWWADNALWLRVMDRATGIACLRCFTQTARARGIAIFWQPIEEAANGD